MKTVIGILGVCVLGAGVAASEMKSAREMPVGPKEVRVSLSSANIGDCNAGAAPASPAPQKAESQPLAESAVEGDSAQKLAPDCTNSLQLSVRSGGKAKGKIRVKSVELFDAGKLVGELKASDPVLWNDSSYEKWDEKAVADETLSVSYTLTEPDWSKTADRRTKTFRIRVKLKVGTEDRALEEDVAIEQDVSLPAGVVT